MRTTKNTGIINCDCPASYLKSVWNEKLMCNEIICTRCQKKAEYKHNLAKKKSTSKKLESPSDSYIVPAGYQNWKAGYGFRHNPKENGVRLYSCQL